MKLRNKKTGEVGTPIVGYQELYVDTENGYTYHYESLQDMCEGWEDYEEPFSTSFYTIVNGEIKHCIFYRERVAGCPDDAWAYIKDDGRESINHLKAVGLYFETKEEAEKAVEKLKAWKRLKDKGLHVTTFYAEDGSLVIRAKTHNSSGAENWEDLDLLFSQEDD